ncbi:MAG: phosphatidylcholine--retinol O-acyltransferase, partial [Acinetobacter sp.]
LTTIGYISSMMSFMNSMFLTLTTTSFALALYIKKKLRDKANLRLQQYRELQDQAKTKVSDLTNLKHR